VLSCATGVLGLAAYTRPSHHDLRNRRSRHQLRPRPPPTDRSSPDLLLYGGKTSIGETTRLYAPEKMPATMFTHLVPPHLSKPRTGTSQLRFKKLAPRLDSSEDDLPFGGGNASIGCRTRPHAPVRLWPPSPRASMQKHVRGTRGHASSTRPCQVSPCCATASALIATSARHVAEEKKKKKSKNLVRQNGAFYSPNSSSRPLWPHLEAKFS
jgi:hypothetical protein